MPRYVAFGPRAPSLCQHAERPSDIRPIDFLLRRALHFFEFEEACSLFSFRNVIVKLSGRRAGALRVLEDVKTVVLTLLDKRKCLLEVFLRLTWKTDNDVARQRQ